MSQVISEIKKAKSASLILAALDTETKNNALKAMAKALDENRKKILEANARDVSNAEKMAEKGDLSDSLVKRLKVND